MILTETKGQPDLPRYFARVFDRAGRMNTGQLDFVLPDGRRFRAFGARPGQVAELRIHEADVFARLIREGHLGFCDAYIEGGWSTPDLQAFLDLLQDDNEIIYDGFPGMIFVRSYERMRHLMNGNSKRQAKRNISYHYDLGNAFYALWLDKTMTYSSALFRSGQESLECAQEQKYASLLEQMGVGPGDHVLEIGCGWGGFAEFAAKRGVRVTGLTISQEQHDFAVDRIARAGLSDLVEIRLQDYRDETGKYDGIASIEMFEAVGEKYWPTYFETVRNCLRPGGQAVLQIITITERRFDQYRKGVDFIQKYIFPGGMLPSKTRLREEVGRAGLAFRDQITFGESYSETLRRWHDVFNAKWTRVAELGFDNRFRRMWNFYLTSCAASFHSGNCDVVQVTLQKPG
ncbi:cyclopropane-fatty-acyl-phospholipid synthase family protein [Aliiroseovarius crassostreae]|uniref:Cyclopropane-fatty-acyl-phospholipid synthase family protein n=1 Tax=Aliiroseovarius crassostreae TaxID=154981 RepID=A0A9Q9HBB2_9RHOB|nr:cyclopropane-fatty-acyl-phospholipid synthase family protein [Aliiroseovarius crassostreae]UWP87864.1 cyclopropane-fatty-acyl-phospholipid synthase family protein [Aliiroseovarius crassostreae]UWP91016.1 cyclopropane-fatty-acyl-phospholipid synthase family protein [Aliiroseovarius crassostreae]UWP94205.1 cyclopropane-fatty-acyl-phospholipid synthase family protein [Aliiroseovarius crassostreae]UWP97328.1 cyclopropane-fatty-acyl-phospholipid synthase family protein [Aliiroseovarius crassostre